MLFSLVFLGKKLFLDFGYGSPKEDLEVGLMNFGGDFGLKMSKLLECKVIVLTFLSLFRKLFLALGYGVPKEDLELALMNIGVGLGELLECEVIVLGCLP